jgi:hypothetical protein
MSLKKIIIIVEIVLLTVLIIYLTVWKDNNVQNESSYRSSMKEAYLIAHKAIIKENPNVLLYFMVSTDSIDNPEDTTAGISGLRKYWNLIFTVPNTTSNWIVMVRNKKVKDIIKVKGDSLDKTDLIDNMDSLINSKEALLIAKIEYRLKPGEGWAIGYHFYLYKISGVNTIVVFGRDPSKNFASVSINAETRAIIGAVHKVTYDGVTYNWEQYIKP